jgi:hypothetical protein
MLSGCLVNSCQSRLPPFINIVTFFDTITDAPSRNCTGPVSNLTDFVPILQRLPNYMKTRGTKLHNDLVETYGGMINDIEARMKRGENVPDCLVKTMIESKEVEELDHVDMSILCAAFMIGGVETVCIILILSRVKTSHKANLYLQTASIMQWFSALIPAYPDIQAKAHAELDRVVGRNRLPTVEDEKNLPYIHAIVKVLIHIASCALYFVLSGD